MFTPSVCGKKLGITPPLLSFIISIYFVIPGPTQDALAFEADGHFAWTYYLALHVGYTKRQAFQIASAAYAIDEDRDTGPMEAKPGDAIFGARHPGLFNNPNARIANIWIQFHAFAEQDFATNKRLVEHTREKRKKELWKLALEQRNPGPLIHYTQDYYSHYEWDSVRGHAAVGHQPDFLSFDPEKSRQMTRATIEILENFMREVLGKKPNPIDQNGWDRIWHVLDLLIEANPFHKVVDPLNFDPKTGTGSPSMARALQKLNPAIEDDERTGRLPRSGFATEWFGTSLLTKWIQYDFDHEGKVKDPNYPVEDPKLVMHKEKVSLKKIDQSNYEISLRLPYSLSGLAELKNEKDEFFLTPLPVVEDHYLSDARRFAEKNEVERKDGQFVVETQIERGVTALSKGNIVWTVSINPFGLDLQERKIPILLETHANSSAVVNALKSFDPRLETKVRNSTGSRIGLLAWVDGEKYSKEWKPGSESTNIRVRIYKTAAPNINKKGQPWGETKPFNIAGASERLFAK